MIPANARITSNFNCSCLIPRDSSYTITFGGDDAIFQINLPFTFCFYGTNYTSCFISSNGNIQFGTQYSGFSSSAFPSINVNMIAPFWGDVDFSGSNNGKLSYKVTPSSLIVKWDSAGYYNSHTDKLNTFHLIITNGLDSIVPNGNNVSFCYGDMQWTTGDAFSGVGGFGGVPSTVGINKGNGIDYFQIGRFSAPGIGYNGPYNADDSVDVLDNMHFIFNTCNTGNLAPFTTANVCDTTNVSPFQLVTGEVYVYAPEINQSLTVTHSEQAFKTTSNAFSIVSTETVQGGMIIHYQFDASQVAPGSRIAATITGSDSYSTSANYTRTLYFIVDNIIGISEKEVFEKPFLFPNPASEKLFLSNITNSVTIKLYDIFGNIIIEKIVENNTEKSLPVDKLVNGYYLAKLYSNQQLIRTQKVIVNH
jgi:hypothetical protein